MLDGPNAIWNKLEHAITNVQRAELGLDPLEMSMFVVTGIINLMSIFLFKPLYEEIQSCVTAKKDVWHTIASALYLHGC